jgi:threonine dehydratase
MFFVFLLQIKDVPGKKIGVILCGGNVDMDCLPWQQQL